MIMSKIGMIIVKNKDNSSYSEFVPNRMLNHTEQLLLRKKTSTWEKSSQKKVQRLNSKIYYEFTMKIANEK